LTAMIMVVVIMVSVAGIMAYAKSQKSRAINNSRAADRLSCSQAGFELAKNYFARNFSNWNTYLSKPSVYNPIKSSFNTTPAAPVFNPATAASPDPLFVTNPELFADLDGDGWNDVYMYIRDNQDELPPAADDPSRDNDQTVVVGALCISSTMVPRKENGQLNSNPLLVEGHLSFNTQMAGCSQAYCGDGTNNLNRN